MSDALESIKQLEQEIGIQLEQQDLEMIEEYNQQGFTLDENGNVTGLNLDGSKLEQLPASLSTFFHLKKLRVNYSQLTDISALQGLKHLIVLNLDVNQLADISPLRELSQLTVLYLGSNQLLDISPLQKLNNLSALYLANNQLTDISVLGSLNRLTTLDLSDNQLTDISALRGLSNLATLNLGGNHLTDISSLQELEHLATLNLEGNHLTDISSLQELDHLATLNLEGNHLTDITPLQGLSHLTTLYLRKNKINKLPEGLLNLQLEIDVESEMYLGEKIYLYGNPLETPPMEIVRKGRKAIYAYFKSLEKASGAQPLNEVKVLLVGSGGAGKTSLAKRLLGQSFNYNEPQTHGININDLTVVESNEKIQVHLWDFGGQQIMHATHQFFYSKRSLYILVLDSRKDEDPEYWLKHIESFGGDSPILVVINKIDRNPGFEVNRRFLLSKYENIKGFHRLSCKTNEGVSPFLKTLENTLIQIEIIRITWPAKWFNVKKKLEIEGKIKHFISYKEYLDICIQEKVTEKSGQDTLAQFLNDLGVILHFKDLGLVDTHVLDPRWVTEAVYKIINSQILVEQNGVLNLELLDDILKKESYEDYHYPPEKYCYIIELMEKFELCYQLDRGHVLIPDLLRLQESQFDFDYASSLKFIIQYDFLPRSVMPRFIVRMHRDIKGDLQWRTGVVLEDESYHSTAVTKSDEREQVIYIYVNGDQKRDYFSTIRKTLRDINASFEKLHTTELIPLPDSDTIRVEYDVLIGHELAGKDEIFIGQLRKSYSVSQLLDGIEKETERDIKSDISILPNISPEQQFEARKQELKANERKKILDVNSPKSKNSKEYRNLYKLYEEAYQLENNKELPEAINRYDRVIDKNKHFKKAWEGLERIYNFLGNIEKREKALNEIRLISDIINFETNASQKINLQEIQLHNMEFFDNFSWEFQPRINILLGRNGFGKSHLLRLMVSLLQEDDYISSSYFYGKETNVFAKLQLDRDEKDYMINRITTTFKESIGRVPILAIPDMRFLDKSKPSVGYVEDERSDLREYGAYHFLYNKPFESIIQNFLYEMCIKFMDKGKSFQLPLINLIYNVVQTLADKEFEFREIKPVGNARFEIKVVTEGNENHPLPLQYASQGTLSILSIFGLIYEYLSRLHQTEDMEVKDLLKKTGIVFIDELDAHLHPRWQRKIIKLLRDNFPNVQFFVTAHSPLIVAGCFEGEAAVLRKEKNGFAVKNLYQDFIGYESKELYRKIFEIEDKDDNYHYYMSLRPFKKEILERISQLEDKEGREGLSREEEYLLQKSFDDLDIIEKVYEKEKDRKKDSVLALENHRLKGENKKLLAKIRKCR